MTFVLARGCRRRVKSGCVALSFKKKNATLKFANKWLKSPLALLSPLNSTFVLLSVHLLSFPHSDFWPVISLGCWNISTQISAGLTHAYLNPQRANPGKCAVYCRLGPAGATYGALTRGGDCYCINNYTADGSFNSCNAPCGRGQPLWPGYQCGSSSNNAIVNVYEYLQGGWHVFLLSTWVYHRECTLPSSEIEVTIYMTRHTSAFERESSTNTKRSLAIKTMIDDGTNKTSF